MADYLLELIFENFR